MSRRDDRDESEEERAARREHERELARAWRKRNPEKVRAMRQRSAESMKVYQREWRQRNADHIREYRAAYDAEHRDEVLAQKRAYMKEYSVRQAAERRRKQAKKVSSKKYYEAHKAEHHEYSRQWAARKRAEDPEGYRAMRARAQRRWWANHKDECNAKLRAQRRENPEPTRAASRAYYAAHAEELKAKKRAYYAANRDRVLAANRAWKEREKQRQEAGLPPRRIHTVTAADRAANAAAADEFFTRPRTAQEIAILRTGHPKPVALLEPTPPELLAAFERDSERARIEHALATDLTYADRRRTAEARRWLAAQQPSRREQRQAIEDARLEEIGRQVNERLRHKEPPRHRHHLDPAAPHPMLNPNTTMGMNR